MRRNTKLFPVLFLSVGLLAGCARKVQTPAPGAVRIVDTVETLRSDLERIFADPGFASAQWGVEVVSLDRGDILYEHNAARLYMPASNNKLITTSAALVRLGPEYRYETRLCTDGEIVDGILKGNLIIIGSGDPSAAPRFHGGDPFGALKEWAAALKTLGVRKIEGTIVGDGSAFPGPVIGQGWEWDDLGSGYAAPVSALQFNENTFTVEVTPGEAEGDEAMVRCLPLSGYFSVDAHVETTARGTRSRVNIQRDDRVDAIRVQGTVAAGSDPHRSTLAVQRPVRYFTAAFKQTLQEEGIDVALAPICSSEDPECTVESGLQYLWSYFSPPLVEIIQPLLKVSQNLYAETLARTLGLALRNEGTFAAGREVVAEALDSMAIPSGTYAYADGSGLSRQNLVTADMLIRILKYMYHHRDFNRFYDSLPVAGVDGTIRTRLRGTRAENNVHGKTGSIMYVRCLSGYVRTVPGEMLAFAMIANNFLVSSRSAEYVQDSALERLANFNRTP
jgi:D-alanyl-D-alanine carboxypeptidase/D-alanyl-D-alanine-endopeptidase (penicillin-binding protein 4)